MRRLVWFLAAVLPAIVVAGQFVAPRTAGHGTLRAQEVIPPPASFQYLGAGSCASMACHNAQGPAGAPGSEYTAWAADDKHARAFDVLYLERSKNISKNLKRELPATQDALCLKCHVHPHFRESMPALDLKTFRGDGVSCEVCHGPAERYIAEHHKPSWKLLSPAEKKKFGMEDLKPLPERIASCLACHVGTKDSDVNHDLIAAGHPRLNFEFSSYHDVWKRHWADRLDRDPKYGGSADFAIQAWAQGQVQCARAALQLLEARASDKQKPWPEFAEYDCYACHHDLVKDSWRQKRPGGNPGLVPWSRWYVGGIAKALPGSELEYNLATLRASMERGFGKSDPSKIAAFAKKTRGLLDSRQAELTHVGPADLDSLYHNIVQRDLAARFGSWDEAAQVYFSLAALQNTFSDMKKTPDFFPKLSETVNRLRHDLKFDAHHDSPKSFVGR